MYFTNLICNKLRFIIAHLSSLCYELAQLYVNHVLLVLTRLICVVNWINCVYLQDVVVREVSVVVGAMEVVVAEEDVVDLVEEEPVIEAVDEALEVAVDEEAVAVE